MSAPDERPAPPAPSSRDLSPGRAARATTDEPDEAASQPPLKQHGDALLDGSGSYQGNHPDPERDAAPHE